jgi:hypothetical protein
MADEAGARSPLGSLGSGLMSEKEALFVSDTLRRADQSSGFVQEPLTWGLP